MKVENFTPVLTKVYAIWCYLYNLKNVKNTHGRVLLLVKLQAFTESDTSPWVFFRFFKLYKWYQIAQSVSTVQSVKVFQKHDFKEASQTIIA